MPVVADTGVIYALADAADQHHAACLAALENELETIVVPQSLLAEITYLVSSRLGTDAEVAVIRGLADSAWRIEPLTDADLRRAAELMAQYADARIGFADASVVAVAERLGAGRLYTLDRRHFSMIQPAHVKAFELLP